MMESVVLIDVEDEDAISEVLGHLEHLDEESGFDLLGAAAVRRAHSGTLEWRGLPTPSIGSSATAAYVGGIAGTVTGTLGALAGIATGRPSRTDTRAAARVYDALLRVVDRIPPGGTVILADVIEDRSGRVEAALAGRARVTSRRNCDFPEEAENV